jgi:hypothetical protein
VSKPVPGHTGGKGKVEGLQRSLGTYTGTQISPTVLGSGAEARSEVPLCGGLVPQSIVYSVGGATLSGGTDTGGGRLFPPAGGVGPPVRAPLSGWVHIVVV